MTTPTRTDQRPDVHEMVIRAGLELERRLAFTGGNRILLREQHDIHVARLRALQLGQLRRIGFG